MATETDDDLVEVTLDRDHMIEAGRTSTLLKKGHSYRLSRNHADAIIGAESGVLREDAEARDKKTGDMEIVRQGPADVARSIDPDAADRAARPQQPGNIVGSTAAFEANTRRALDEAKPVETDKPPLAGPVTPAREPTKPLLPSKG